MRKLILLFALTQMLGCGEATQPSHVATIILQGTPYERGLQHGRAFENKIRSLYGGLLTNSLLPYLNRERPDIASVLTRYGEERYLGTEFSYLLMLESAQHMEPDIPPEFIEEMHGIADGAGVSYEQILILNTFLDTMLGFRAMTFFIRKIQAPEIVRVEFDAVVETDGFDNDGDGEVDELGEGRVEPYEPNPYAILGEAPPQAPFRITFRDRAMGIPEGVDPDSIRVLLDTTEYEAPHPSMTFREFMEDGALMLEMTFAPPGGLPPGAVVSVQVGAADRGWVEDPPPAHARVMRDERFVFTTQGHGRMPFEVENRGEDDGRSQPPSLGFALRGSAVADGKPILAHHFALLDSNTTHKHTVLFVHKPANGIPHAVLGWTGVVGGFAGMNTEGLAYCINNSDTLDTNMTDQVVQSIFSAQLVASGLPAVMMGRSLLAGYRTVAEGVEHLRTVKSSFGWNVLLQDATGDMASVEMDANMAPLPDDGFFVTTSDATVPENLDPHGRLFNSVGLDDLRIASHALRNTEDMRAQVMSYEVLPQRYWTSFYFQSMRAHYLLGEQLAIRYGTLDAVSAQEVLRVPSLVDDRDSMTAAVFVPTDRVLYYALGTVPATDTAFVPFDLAAATAGGAP